MISLERTSELFLLVSVEFDYEPASPARLPTMNDPGDPPEAAEIEITAIYIGKTQIPLESIPAATLDDLANELLLRLANEESDFRATRRSGAARHDY